jgi:hypothetical protein
MENVNHNGQSRDPPISALRRAREALTMAEEANDGR